MDKSNVDEIIALALDQGLEVHFAKRPGDAKREGVHVSNPTYEELVFAIKSALMFGVNQVWIHGGMRNKEAVV